MHESGHQDELLQTSKQQGAINQLLQIGAIQEFIHVREISEIYTALTEVNLK